MRGTRPASDTVEPVPAPTRQNTAADAAASAAPDTAAAHRATAPTGSTARPPAHPPALPDDAVDAVIAWYAENARDLPWRDPDRTAWGVLVSEVMLQQTPVARVLPRWQEWMRRWPGPADLAEAPTAEVLRAWDRLGYPRRALRLQECARVIRDRHAGTVPHGQDALLALPGIGAYTAAAVTAFAHGEHAVVVDTNIRRVLARAVQGRALPAPSLTAAEQRLAAATVPAEQDHSVAWNQAVMELGALICTARTAHCEQCPLSAGHCRWLAAGKPSAPAGARRVQAFEGTDRQMRGQIMALLREHGQAGMEQMLALDPQDPQRVRRCAASLCADSLAVQCADGGLRLP